MNTCLRIALAAGLGCLAAAAQENPPENPPNPAEAIAADPNVNSKYTIERAEVTRTSRPGRSGKRLNLSDSLRAEVDQLVGQKLDRPRLDDLAKRIKTDLRAADVAVKVDKGTSPEHVAVNFEVRAEPAREFDLDVARLLYHSRQGWSAEGNARIHAGGNAFLFGLVSDNDALAERYAGFRAGYERRNMGTDRLQLRFIFSSFHQQWNGATLAAAPAEEIYRERHSFAPLATVVLAQPFEWSFGVDFTRYLPNIVGARTESSNAAVTTLRYRQRWGSARDWRDQEAQASYSIRTGTGVLESDRVFARHAVEAGYRLRQGRNRLDVRFLAGRIGGAAPLFERFVLGNSKLLRGWNRFDLAPLGASQVVHGTIEYSYRGLMFLYDTGAIWDRPAQREQKQSLGIGFRDRRGFQMAVAFPVRAGRADPIFYVGAGF
jgi:hypothetical protein